MAYIGAEPDGMGKAQRFTFTASGSGTDVTADDDGIPIGYTTGQVSVYLNGVKQVIGSGKDVTATDGSTITFASAYAADDVIEVVALSIFSATTVEGTALISTGETGGSKFLREDGDGTSSWQTVPTPAQYNDDVVQTNIALLAFKTAVNGSLAKYNLQDQVIDEYAHASDTSGIDDGPSTNHVLASGAYSAPAVLLATGATSIDTSVSGYTILVCSAASGSVVITANKTADILVVGGGGAGGNDHGGGGGAGGLIYMTASNYSVTANTYNWVSGAGGTGLGSSSGAHEGGVGSDSTWIISGGVTEFTAKGGGGGGGESHDGVDGGSGGGTSYEETAKTPGASTQSAQAGNSGTYGFGFRGGNGVGSTGFNPGGGGGAGSVGQDASSTYSGDGGAGKDYGAIFGTAVGDGGWFASGGGGGFTTNGSGAVGDVSNGGGTAGSVTSGVFSAAGQNNTGGGSGGGSSYEGNTGTGAGGTGVILIRFATADYEGAPENLTLQSTDTEAEAQPTKADMIMLVEDAGTGVGTVNTHIKGHISRDSGTTFTEGVLVDEGDWGTDKRILAFHDLDISSQPADQTMCYKITTHSASAVYNTKIHATSIGWR